MLRRALVLTLLCFSASAFAAKSVSYLRVTAANALIQHGASENSAVEATATKGQVFPLMGTKLYNGFYKIEYRGHMSFIAAEGCVVLDVKGTPQPTPVPTKAGTAVAEEEGDDGEEERPTPTVKPTLKATPKPGHDDEEEEEKRTPTVKPTLKATEKPGHDDGHEDGGEDEHEKRTPTVKPTLKATEKPGHDDDHEEDEEGHGRLTPTVFPTRAPTPQPTRVPTPEPTAEPTEVPTAVPTRIPTRVPTAAPTLEPTEEPTELPTAVPTRIPTRVPTAVPTLEPTQPPTAVPTRIPTRVPTAVPTAVPTRIPTALPWPTAAPTPMGPSKARGKRRQTGGAAAQTATPERRASRVDLGSTLQFGSTVASNLRLERAPGKLNDVELHLPLGWSKHETLVQPPFKQNPGMNDQRAIEFAGFAGLGLEIRSARWLRWDFDWIAYSHRTKAADLGIPALKVNVPGAPATTLFDESEAYYRMNAHEFRLGVKAGVPLGSVVEPWVSASYGAWIWTAELADLNREIIYGEDSGVAFGGSLGLGVDFHGDFSNGMGWTVTPFVEWGAPQVNPQFRDVAGLGVDWKDDFGTPVAIPARAGIQFGIGF